MEVIKATKEKKKKKVVRRKVKVGKRKNEEGEVKLLAVDAPQRRGSLRDNNNDELG